MNKIVEELSEALGLPDAILIVRKWGGRDLNVPKTIGHGDPLALALGLDTARRLVDNFAGIRLQLPSERNALLEMRNAAIAAERRRGDTLEDIAVRWGLTRQAVGYVVKKVAEAQGAKICGRPGGDQSTQSRANP
ncbi:MAG: Mor transcription activator family protein [Steroidobacteraceae bacterium]